MLLNTSGADQRQDDLFSTESLLAKGRSALKGLKGAENVYTQHNPHLSQTLELLLKGKLKETSYPFLESPGPNAGLQRSDTSSHHDAVVNTHDVHRPQDIIIFMIGGTTYEESIAISAINQPPPTGASGGTPSGAGVRILLGGTCVHNSSS